MKSNRWTAAAAAISILMTADAFAQRGGLRGRLVDEAGQPLEGIECRIELYGGGGRATSVTTKKNGEFAKAGLQVGNYVVTCEKEGYRPLPLAAATVRLLSKFQVGGAFHWNAAGVCWYWCDYF